MKVRYKRAALSDLNAIRDYGVAHWGVPRTVDFVGSLIDAIATISDTPRLGRPRREIAEGMRSLRHRGYVIFFVFEDERPVVIAVRSERQDMAALDFADRMEGEA